jgi:hypothetical protein
MNMKNVRYVFAGLLLFPGIMYGLCDWELRDLIKNGSKFAQAHPEVAREFVEAYDQAFSSKAHKNLSAAVLLFPELEEDASLPVSMLRGDDSVEGTIKRKERDANIAWHNSKEYKRMNEAFSRATPVFYRWEDKLRGR